MIKNFSGNPNVMAVFGQALRFASFEAIKNAFVQQLASSPSFTSAQKLAIRLAAEKLRDFPGSDLYTPDGPLLGILKLAWEDIAVDTGEVAALLPEQRVAIFDAVLTISKGIISAEAQRLNDLAALNTTLPTDWNEPDPVEEPANG